MNKQKTRRPELLAPAGNMEKFFTALHFGADAVYLAGKNFGLRAFADNFTLDEIKFCCGYAHEKGKKVYVTVNIFADGRDLEKLPDYISALDNCGADALIVSDAGVMQIAKSVAPRLPLHLSTQANCTNARAAEFWRDAGVSRIVAARECGFDDLVQMAALKDCELEIFVHGAMCMAYSGRCLLSSWLSGRGGNKGECVQACRWEWQVSLTEREHPDKPLFLNEDERGVYIMNSRDLCLMPYLNRALETGAVSLKIEGRMKSAHYVGTVVNAYRRALDACLTGSFSKSVSDGLLNELKRLPTGLLRRASYSERISTKRKTFSPPRRLPTEILSPLSWTGRTGLPRSKCATDFSRATLWKFCQQTTASEKLLPSPICGTKTERP